MQAARLTFPQSLILARRLFDPAQLWSVAQQRVQLFRLNPLTERAPTTFEPTVPKDSVHYQYGFDLRPDQIVWEWLIVYMCQATHEIYEL